MGRWNESKFAENKRRREFLLLGIAGGAGVIALAALGVAKKGGGGGVSGTGVAPKIPFWSSSSTLGNSQAQYIAADPSISPTTTNAVDLGDASLRWRSGYFSGSVFTNIIDTGSSQLNLVTGGQGAQIDGSFNPTVDNISSLGSATKRWSVGYFEGSGIFILAASGDSNPTSNLRSGELDFGAGGASAVDVKIARVSSTELSSNVDIEPTVDDLRNLGTTTLRWHVAFAKKISAVGSTLVLTGGNNDLNWDGGILYSGDNVRQIGNASNRWNNMSTGSGGYAVFGASGDANPQSKLINSELDFGPGGASAVDVYLKRISAGLLETQAIRPQTDTIYGFGTSSLRWGDVFSSAGFKIIASAGDSKPIATMDNTPRFALGPGGSTAVDVILSRDSGSLKLQLSATGKVFEPDTDNVYDIGTTLLRWRTLNGVTLHTGQAANSTGLIDSPSTSLTINGNNNLFMYSSNGSFIVGSGTTNNNILPVNDASADIGNTGQRWRNLNLSGTITRYNGVSPVGFGVPTIVAEGDSTGNTGTIASVAAYTVGVANGVFKVGGDLDVTAYTSGTINLQVTYTDWNSGAQTITIDSAGVLGDALGNEVTLMAKASTSITIKTTGTFTATYNVAATIIQVK